MPESLRQYDRVTRDEYLRAQGVSEAALHMMNLGYTPVARFRSFLDVLHENAVYRELSRRAGTENEQILKIDGGNDRLPRAFADRLGDRLKIWMRGPPNRTRRARRARLLPDRPIRRVRSGGLRRVCCSVLNAQVGRIFTRSPSEKRSVIESLPYESVTRIYLQTRDRYWTRQGLSGFAETDHPMEIWDSTYGQPGTRGILMSYNRGPKARWTRAQV